VSKRRIIVYSVLAVLGLLSLLLGGAVVWYVGLHDTGMSLDFDPVKTGQSEAKMWQYYYTNRKAMLALEMFQFMRGQFGASLKTAYEVAEPMARGASEFYGIREGYNERVLPKLEESYARLAIACGKDWDAKALAEAELAWWVARRTPGENSPEQVGALIAKLYTEIYRVSNPEVDRAGFLRAQAAALRDEGGVNTDWDRVESLLVESYTALQKGIHPGE
jgi:hypothetical protein